LRTALFLGVAGSLLLAGCGGPMGSPAQTPQTPQRGAQLSLPATQPRPVSRETVAREVARLEEAGVVAPGRVIIRFTPEASTTDRTELLDKVGLRLDAEIPQLGYGRYLMTGDGSVRAALEALWTSPLVASAEPDLVIQANAISISPGDPRFAEQTYLKQIRIPEAWFIHPGDPRDAVIGPTIPAVSDVTIAVLDTGFDFTHEDLNFTQTGDPRGDNVKVYGGIDLVNGDSDATDDNGHGTMIAGIAAARTHTGGPGGFAQGIAGASWNARIMPVKVLDENGAGTSFDSARGILHAVETWSAARGNAPAPPFVTGQNNSIFTQPYFARLVINMSYSVEVPNSLGAPQFERDAINFAVNNGAVLVAAAGDQGKPVDDGFSSSYPAAHAPVIAVGAVDEINQSLITSNRPKTTVPLAGQRFVVAPGANILGTAPMSMGRYGVGTGTSVAAAQVSGLVALMWSYYPLLLNEDGLIPTLLETADSDVVGDPGPDNATGAGLVDALAALEGVFEPRPTNDPIIVRAFTDPIAHNVVHFVILSKYRLMDPAEIPFFINDAGEAELINGGAAFSYRIGIDTNNNGTLEDAELLRLDGAFFPNEIIIGQLDDSTYSGRIFFVQGPAPAPACPAGSLQPPPPPTGNLIVQVTGVPEDFLIDATLPKTISASTTLAITSFANS